MDINERLRERGFKASPAKPRKNPTLQDAVDIEAAKLARIITNIQTACEDGRISEHDRDERIARAEQRTENRIAFLKGEPRPKQRQQQPLDDPDAGKVG